MARAEMTRIKVAWRRSVKSRFYAAPGANRLAPEGPVALDGNPRAS